MQLGITIKTITEVMGHYSTAFNMDVYGHATEQMHQEAAERLQIAICKRLGTPSKQPQNELNWGTRQKESLENAVFSRLLADRDRRIQTATTLFHQF